MENISAKLAEGYTGQRAGRSLLITLEGIECSGKTTQAPLLADYLRQAGWNVRHLREPGGTELGETVRGILKSKDINITPMAELFLFCAARAQLVLEIIDPALRKPNSVVLMDRFYDATYAYQGCGRGLPVEPLTKMVAPIVPDITFILDIPVETMNERLILRAEQEGIALDRIELSSRTFFEAVRKGYLELPALHPERNFCVLDGRKSVDDLQAEICAVLQRDFLRYEFPESNQSTDEEFHPMGSIVSTVLPPDSAERVCDHEVPQPVSASARAGIGSR